MSKPQPHTQPYVVESKRLYLQRLNIDTHLEDFHELWCDEETVRWTIRTPKRTLLETKEWFPSIMPSVDIPDIDKFAILIKSEYNHLQTHHHNQENDHINTNAGGNKEEEGAGKKLKCIGILGTNRWSDQGMETGYVINRDYWGKGFATEALEGFLGWFWGVDERKEIDHLVAKVYVGHEKSLKVLRKCGGKEGEALKGVEMRGNGDGEKADMRCFYFDRPDGGKGGGDGAGK